MIKERLILGVAFLLGSGLSYYFTSQWQMFDTFVGGGSIVGTAAAGIAYLIFSFETPEYLEQIYDKKKK